MEFLKNYSEDDNNCNEIQKITKLEIYSKGEIFIQRGKLFSDTELELKYNGETLGLKPVGLNKNESRETINDNSTETNESDFNEDLEESDTVLDENNSSSPYSFKNFLYFGLSLWRVFTFPFRSAYLIGMNNPNVSFLSYNSTVTQHSGKRTNIISSRKERRITNKKRTIPYTKKTKSVKYRYSYDISPKVFEIRSLISLFSANIKLDDGLFETSGTYINILLHGGFIDFTKAGKIKEPIEVSLYANAQMLGSIDSTKSISVSSY